MASFTHAWNPNDEERPYLIMQPWMAELHVPLTTKLMCGALYSLATMKRSNALRRQSLSGLARWSGLSRRMARAALNDLVELELVRLLSEDGSTRFIVELLPHPIDLMERYRRVRTFKRAAVKKAA